MTTIERAMIKLFFFASIVHYATFALALTPVAKGYWFDGNHLGAGLMLFVAFIQLICMRGLRTDAIRTHASFDILTTFIMIPGTVALVAFSLVEIADPVMRRLAIANGLLYTLASAIRVWLMILQRRSGRFQS